MAPKKNIKFHRLFRKPSSEKILKIIRGTNIKLKLTKHLPTLEKLLTAFRAIPEPTDELDWLAQFNEPEQDFDEFIQNCPVESADLGTKKFIYYVQLGEFSQVPIEFSSLIEYSQSFFSAESVVCLEKSISIKRVTNSSSLYGFDLVSQYGDSISRKIKFRYDKATDKLQLDTCSFFGLLEDILPVDACCLLALTEFDLYVEASDLFVAGLANGRTNVAVFSYLRYNPNLRWHFLKQA